MNKNERVSLLILGVASFAATLVISCTERKPRSPKLSTAADSLAYVLGMGYADYLKTLPVDINVDIVTAGMKDKMTNAALLIDREQASQIRITLNQRIQEQRVKEISEKNAREAERFFAENRQRPDVKETPSGLQYQILKDGRGPKPDASSTVKVHYVGTLLDGTEFDSSRRRGQPTTFPLNAVIPGWTEGLQLMSVGSIYRFWIPAKLAYGERGAPPKIEPGTALSFEIELLDIVR